MPASGEQADHAGVEDQTAAVAHDSKRVLRDKEGPLDVDRHHRVEDVLGVVDDRRVVAEDARVGERDVGEPAEALDGDPHGVVNLIGVGDVGDDVGGALGSDLVGDRGQPVLVDIGQDDLRPLVGEQPGRSGPDLPPPPVMSATLSCSRPMAAAGYRTGLECRTMAGERAGIAPDVAAAGNGGTAAPTVRDATFDVLRRLGLTTIFSNPASTEISLPRRPPPRPALRAGVARGLGRRHGHRLRVSGAANRPSPCCTPPRGWATPSPPWPRRA